MINKEEQYYMVYFPDYMIEQKNEAYLGLLSIDANFSTVLQLIMPDILDAAKKINEKKLNFRHYEWKLIVNRRKEEK